MPRARMPHLEFTGASRLGRGIIPTGFDLGWAPIVQVAGILRRWVALAACGLLVACTVGPDFVRPPAPAVTQYMTERGAELSPADARQVEQRVTPGQKPPPEWWRQYQSPDLDRVVEEAVAHNRSLAATAATLAQAQQQVLAASGALLLHIDFAASVTEQKYGAAFLRGQDVRPLPNQIGGQRERQLARQFEACEIEVGRRPLARRATGQDRQGVTRDAELLAQGRQQRAVVGQLALGYNVGNAGILQVLDAERLLAQARLGYVRAKAQRYLDTTQLFLAVGGGATSPAAP